jgi:hypothetical protein
MLRSRFEKRKQLLESKYKQTLKYREDYLPEYYNQEFRCWDCGLTKNRKNFPYRKQYKFNKDRRCKTCNRLNVQKRRENQTEEQVINLLLYQCKVNCEKRKKGGRGKCAEMEVNSSDINELLQKQNYLCAYSGKMLEWKNNYNYKCSIDRIDSNVGYIYSNIQLVGWIVNQAKNDLTHNEFLNLISSIKFGKPTTKFTDVTASEINTPNLKKIKLLLKTAKSSAKYRSTKYRQDESDVFNITIQDILDLNESQSGKCIYSGYNLWNMGEKVSLDRIESSKGYNKDNIQLTTFKVNQAKSNLTHDQFIDMVDCIYEYSISNKKNYSQK